MGESPSIRSASVGPECPLSAIFVAYRECDVVDPRWCSSASSVWISPQLVSLLLIPLLV